MNVLKMNEDLYYLICKNNRKKLNVTLEYKYAQINIY